MPDQASPIPPSAVTMRDPATGVAHDIPAEQIDTYRALGFTPETAAERGARLSTEVREATYGGVGGKIGAGATALLRGATLGGSDALARALGDENTAYDLRAYRDVNPITSGVAEFTGAVLPSLVTGGAALPAGAVGRLGAGVTERLGGGLLAKGLGGATEGALYGAGSGVSELALSEDPLSVEHAASVLSSNMLYGGGVGAVAGAAAHGLERGLARARTAITDHMAARSALEAIPPDIASMDAAELRVAHEAESERLAQAQAAQRTADRSAAVDDLVAYRQQVKDANPWLVINEGEPSKQLSKANNAIRNALDTPKALRESPGRLLGPLEVEEQALQHAVDNRAEIVAKLDEQNAKIAAELENQVGSASQTGQQPPAPSVPEHSAISEDAFARHQLGVRAAMESGLTDVGSPLPKLSIDAQQGIRSEMSGLAKEYGLHHRLSNADYSDSVLVAHPNEANPALRFKHEGMPAQLYNETSQFPGLVMASPEQVGLLAEHATMSPSELRALGRRAAAGDQHADDLLFASHVMQHENLHGFGPAIEEGMHRSAIEELTTEMASRRITADMHGVRPSFVGTYNQVIDPIVDSVAKAAGVSREQAYEALEKAALKFKGRSGKISADQAIHDVAGDALEHLKVRTADAQRKVTQDVYRVSREIGTAPIHDAPAPRTPASSTRAAQTWREFQSSKMAEYMKSEGGHAGAMKRMGAEWKAMQAGAGMPAAVPPMERPVTLTGRTARRYASFADEKLPKGGSITVERADARAFLDALKSGDVQGEAGAALDQIGGLLERNRALQTQIKAAAAPGLPKAELTSDKLTAIKAAKDALATPEKKSMLQNMLGGSVFGGVTAAIGAIPVIGQIPGLAHLAGAKGAELANNLVFGKLGKTIGEQATKRAAAVASFLGKAEAGVQAASSVAPLVATKALAALRYGSRDDDKAAGDQTESRSLPDLYKARTDEIKQQVHIAADGSFQMRPAARQKMADQLKAIGVVDPVLADRLESAGARRIAYLAAMIPRRPDLAGIQVGPDTWQPSDMEMRTWARRAWAAERPMEVLDRVARGSVTPEDAETMQAVHPEIMRAFINEVSAELPVLRKALSYDKQLALSIFSGVPVTPALDPKVIGYLQGQFPSEPGSAGGTQAPKPVPQFGALQKSIDNPTPAQTRSQGAHA